MGRLYDKFHNMFVRGTVVIEERTFAKLPSDPHMNELAAVSDSSTATSGATIAGGSTNHVLARFDGSNWVVVA